MFTGLAVRGIAVELSRRPSSGRISLSRHSGGPSGAGKSYLARRFGRPHLPLDAYYREIGEDPEHGGPGPALPRTDYGEIDWDHHLTWNEQAAVDGIVELLEEGVTLLPVYEISVSARTGSTPLALDGPGPIIAEGILRTG